MFGKMISNMIVKPGKSPVFETPEKYNLAYKDVTFKSSEGVALSAWLINSGKLSS